MSVELAAKASGVPWPKWDPTVHWSERKLQGWLAAEPQEGYRFPQYLGHTGSGPWRLGAIFSRPHDPDAIIYAPEAMPAERAIFKTGPVEFSQTDREIEIEQHTSSLAFKFLPRPPITREFHIRELEHHCINLESCHIKSMIVHPSVNEILSRRGCRGRVWVITGLKVAHRLEVSDGGFYRKFDGPVIFSYRMHEVGFSSGRLEITLVEPCSEIQHSNKRNVELYKFG